MIHSPSSTDLLRLQTLDHYELLELRDDRALDDIVRLAAQVCHASAAAITFVEQDQISLAARFGISVTQVPRHTLPCESAIGLEGVYQVPKASSGDGNEPVDEIQIGGTIYRFYAGAPIVMAGGEAIGCLCVLDVERRELSASETASLQALSHMVVTRLELHVRVRQMERAARGRQRVD